MADWEHTSCSLCYGTNPFKVLQCGHAYCITCLQILKKCHDENIPCPRDRIVNRIEILDLPTVSECKTKLLAPPRDEKRYETFNQLIDALVQCRRETIEQLRIYIEKIDALSISTATSGKRIAIAFAIVMLTFSIGKAVIFGETLSSFLVNLIACGLMEISVLAAYAYLTASPNIQDVQQTLASDCFKSEQMRVILMRAAQDAQFAERWQVDSSHLSIAGKSLPTAVDNTTAGLLGTNLIGAASKIPCDLSTRRSSGMITFARIGHDTLSLAEDLEKKLRIFLVGASLFDLVRTDDGNWAYVLKRAESLVQSKAKIVSFVSLAQLKRHADIIESGTGEQPSVGIQRRIQMEWLSHYDEFIAVNSQGEKRKPVFYNDPGISTSSKANSGENVNIIHASSGATVITGNVGSLSHFSHYNMICSKIAPLGNEAKERPQRD